MGENWDTNHDGLRAIFIAAIQGICANPHFIDTYQFQGSPEAAVEFANKVVLATLKSSADSEDDPSPLP